MLEFLIHIVVTALLLAVVAKLLPGMKIEGPAAALLGALALGLANAIVRPIVIVLTIPLTILTLGLFLFVVNALMLMLAAAVVPGFKIEGCGTAVLASIILWLLNLVVSAILF